MPEISPSGSQRFKEKQFITILRDMMPKHSYVPPKFYSCPKHMKSLQDFCIQRSFSPHEKQTEYLCTYVRLSPLGTGPKPNNQPLLRRWLWTKPSWGSISCRLIYSCVSAKQPSYEQKHQQELHKYPGTLEARLDPLCSSFGLFDGSWCLISNHVTLSWMAIDNADTSNQTS